MKPLLSILTVTYLFSGTIAPSVFTPVNEITSSPMGGYFATLISIAKEEPPLTQVIELLSIKARFITVSSRSTSRSGTLT